MAYDPNKPSTDGPLVSADIRENFRALKDDYIVKAATTNNLEGIFESGEYSAFNANTILTVAHGLEARPRFVFAMLRCVIAELGYNVGDETYGSLNDDYDRWGPLPVRTDATNIYYAYGDRAPYVVRQVADKDADWFTITPANWRLVFRAIR